MSLSLLLQYYCCEKLIIIGVENSTSATFTFFAIRKSSFPTVEVRQIARMLFSLFLFLFIFYSLTDWISFSNNLFWFGNFLLKHWFGVFLFFILRCVFSSVFEIEERTSEISFYRCLLLVAFGEINLFEFELYRGGEILYAYWFFFFLNLLVFVYCFFF